MHLQYRFLVSIQIFKTFSGMHSLNLNIHIDSAKVHIALLYILVQINFLFLLFMF